jgi:peptidyl-prolyl cis-trans isomerase A (cyclophilin A)
MKAKIFLVLMAALLTMGSACTKSCKGQSPNAVPPTTNSKESSLEPQGEKEKPMETNTAKDKLAEKYALRAGDKLVAEIETNQGTIKAELFWEQAPNTSANFVDLATGNREWVHPSTQEKSSKPLYDGTIFHRVIKGFMIQGGDPTGTGMGGPGYRFKDEFHPSLRHSKKGILSMANSGPNSNGSQFFITEGPTPHLDNRHSVFGEVNDAESLGIISKIASQPTGPQDKPLTDVIIKTIKIHKG